jgi:hypothetical protein
MKALEVISAVSETGLSDMYSEGYQVYYKLIWVIRPTGVIPLFFQLFQK